MKTDVEMKAILSATPARCCNGNYNHYDVLLDFDMSTTETTGW